MNLLDNTLGAAYLGLLVAAILYGVTSVQTFIYFRNCKADRGFLRAMVLVLWILDTVHLAFTAHGLYFYLVSNFGNYIALLSPTGTLIGQVYITTLSDFIVRGFFAKRVSVLCGSRKILSIVLPVIITALSLIVFVFGVAFASKGFVLVTYERMQQVSYMLYVSLSAAVAADTVIAVSLCTLLVRSRTGFKGTDSIVTKLMAFSINTGLLTSIAAIACLVTYAIWPSRFIFMGIYFGLSKLFVNSLLASLNARRTLRETNTVTVSIPGTAISTSNLFPMKETTTTKDERYSESA